MKHFVPAILICFLLIGCNYPSATPVQVSTAEFEVPVTETDDGDALAPVDRMLLECPTAAQIASIDADISITFESDPTASQGLACTNADGSKDFTHFQRRIYNILLAMKELEFDEPLPWTDKQLYEWFVDAIDGMRFRSDIEYSACCDPTGIINIQTNNLVANEMDRWIDPATNNGLVHIMILFIHEARHNEGFGHTCTEGNDNTLEEMGAWSVQYYIEIWLADHATGDFLLNPSQDYAEAMRSEANWILETRFCQK
jgi:hypothetical protein